MINFTWTFLVATVALVLASAQDIGVFRYETEDYNFDIGITDDSRVIFAFSARTRVTPDTPVGTPLHHSFSLGTFPLSWGGGVTYDIDISSATIRDWYTSIGDYMVRAGQIEPDDHYPPAGIETGDFTTITYMSGDSLFTTFRGEKIEFIRVGRNLIAGTYEYHEDEPRNFKLSYDVDSDGSVYIQAECNGQSTARLPFKLVRRPTAPWGDELCLPNQTLEH
ncbi:hypothetical protein FOZ63_011635 [Perkinsus olseni]|uniref:Uncharacterized protein n=1 Tax=Perkinsus olseni TaxID=32597 RepID=A0A7J6UNG5_PEROL|nr:hypothetical protein FOZ63_011635 [Perkinsus olseni]